MRKPEPANRSDYRTLEAIVVIACAFHVSSIIFRWTPGSYLSLFLLLIGLFDKKRAGIIAACWTKFTEILGAVNTRVILTAVFYLLLTPIAFLYRRLKGDFMGIKSQKNEKTLWHTRNHMYMPADIENLW